MCTGISKRLGTGQIRPLSALRVAKASLRTDEMVRRASAATGGAFSGCLKKGVKMKNPRRGVGLIVTVCLDEGLFHPISQKNGSDVER